MSERFHPDMLHPEHDHAEDRERTEAEWRDLSESAVRGFGDVVRALADAGIGEKEPAAEDSYGHTPQDYVAIARALDSCQDTMALDATMLEGMCRAFISILHEREDALVDLGGKRGIGTLYSRGIARGFLRAVEQLDQKIEFALKEGK